MMIIRICLLTGALIASTTPAAAQRSQRGSQAPRTVQLIAMTSPAPAGEGAVVAADEGSEPALPVDFQVHELGRQWVEFQMEQRLHAPLAAADPFAPQTRAAISGMPASSAAMLGIPSWMQARGEAASPSTAFVPGCDPRPYQPSGFLKFDAEARRQTYYGMMSRIACEYGLPISLFDAMIIRESRYDPAIVSPKNAFGLTQLMPGTASGLGVDRYDVVQNLRGGASYLRRQLDRFGQYHLALAAYNAGPGRVRGVVPPIAETRAYVDDILRNWSRLSGFEQMRAARRLTGEVTPARATYARSATLVAFR